MSTVPVEIKPIESRLAILDEQAAAIQVKDAESYALACQITLNARKEIKAIGFALDPGINSAREHLETLRNRKNAFVNRVKPIVELASGKAAAWREQERLAAEAEQQRVNAERRRMAAEEAEEAERAARAAAELERKRREKGIEAARKSGELKKREAARLAKEAAEEAERAKEQARKNAVAAAVVKEVKVKASIPKIAGIKGRTEWKWAWKDDGENDLLDSFRENMSLRPLVQANEQQIGAMVRRIKDKKKAEAECPGIEVWSKDAT